MREAVSLEVGGSHEGLEAARVAAHVGALGGEPRNLIQFNAAGSTRYIHDANLSRVRRTLVFPQPPWLRVALPAAREVTLEHLARHEARGPGRTGAVW